MVRTPYGDAATAPIHEVDIAAVAAAALLDGDHTGQRYELTGPERITGHPARTFTQWASDHAADFR